MSSQAFTRRLRFGVLILQGSRRRPYGAVRGQFVIRHSLFRPRHAGIRFVLGGSRSCKSHRGSTIFSAPRVKTAARTQLFSFTCVDDSCAPVASSERIENPCLLSCRNRRHRERTNKVITSADRPTEAKPQRRIIALDGLRGMLTVMVVLSHYFAETRGGFASLAFGWVAVDAFFVLSGLLVGRLILEKGHHGNFLSVFYIRRACRTFPVYFICLAASLVLACFVPSLWRGAGSALQTWTYGVFVQNIAMVLHRGVGVEWLAPTWTLAVEEQFYLVVPALMLVTPRRWTMLMLATVAVLAVVTRFALVLGSGETLAALALLPTRADSLAIGLMAAVALVHGRIDWSSWSARLLTPSAILFALAVEVVGGHNAVTVAGHTLVSAAAAVFMLTLIAEAPEADRFKGSVLPFFGAISYATYLVHLPVLWLMHRLVLQAAPSLTTSSGVAVTLACLPLTFVVAWLITRVVEDPFTTFGRRFAWSSPTRQRSGREAILVPPPGFILGRRSPSEASQRV